MKWPFDVTLRCDLPVNRAVREGLEPPKIITESGNVAVPPPAVDQIVLTGPVVEDKLVNRLRSIVESIHQRLAQIIL